MKSSKAGVALPIILFLVLPKVLHKALAIAIRTIAIAIAIEAKKAIEYCNMK